MADFLKSYRITKKFEGGYSNEAKDTGGETYKGISRVSWPKWEGWKTVDLWKSKKGGKLERGFVIPDDTLDKQVLGFYKRNYWDILQGDKINSQVVAQILFDFGVNAGLGQSVKHAQRSLKLKDDGQLGPITLNAINKAPEKSLSDSINKQNESFYKYLAQKNPDQYAWALKGWLSRVEYFKGLIDKLPSGSGPIATVILLTGVFFLGKSLLGK